MTKRSYILIIFLVTFTYGIPSINMTHSRGSPNRGQFHEWYPQYALILRNLTETVCADVYHAYYTGINDLGLKGGFEDDVISCLLEELSEFAKARMASASVLLALLPTITSFIGSTTTEISLLFLQRPLLAALLTAGSCPATPLWRVGTSFTQHYATTEVSCHHVPWSAGTKWPMVVFEYSVALLAIANVIHTCHDMGRLAVCVVSPQTTYFPILWVSMSLPIIILNSLVICHNTDTMESHLPMTKLWLQDILSRLSHGSKRCGALIALVPTAVVGVVWLVLVGAFCQFIFGTMIFASYMFVGHKDALKILARLGASTLICRWLADISRYHTPLGRRKNELDMVCRVETNT